MFNLKLRLLTPRIDLSVCPPPESDSRHDRDSPPPYFPVPDPDPPRPCDRGRSHQGEALTALGDVGGGAADGRLARAALEAHGGAGVWLVEAGPARHAGVAVPPVARRTRCKSRGHTTVTCVACLSNKVSWGFEPNRMDYFQNLFCTLPQTCKRWVPYSLNRKSTFFSETGHQLGCMGTPWDVNTRVHNGLTSE